MLHMPRSALRELVETRLGQDVCEWMRARQEAEPQLGWRPLSVELSRLTGRHISYTSLANWCRGELDSS
jgi:hypothetical protein